MKSNYLKILLFILISTVVHFFDDYRMLAEFYFYILIFIIGYDLFINKKIGLLTVWNFAFLFIIISEPILSSVNISNFHLIALQYLITANNIINIGYFSKKRKLYNYNIDEKNVLKIKSFHVTVIFIVLVLIFFLLRIQRAFYIFTVGRNVAYVEGYEGVMFSELINSIGLVLPTIMTFYYVILKNKRFRVPLLLSLPIFIIHFLGGTRFPLLFSFIGMLIVYQSSFSFKKSLKNYITMVFLVFILFLSGQLMKHYRSSSTKDTQFELLKSDTQLSSLYERTAGYMSNEGVINTTSMLFSYFEQNDYMYGKSSSFLLYFWVPRQIWPDKPTMLGHWFIRERSSNISSAHSVSFGFTGDLYADFGMLSLVFIFFLGRLLKYAEDFKNYALKSKGYIIIFGAMLYPYTFFFVRSPITATMNFLGILLIYFLFKNLIFIKK